MAHWVVAEAEVGSQTETHLNRRPRMTKTGVQTSLEVLASPPDCPSVRRSVRVGRDPHLAPPTLQSGVLVVY